MVAITLYTPAMVLLGLLSTAVVTASDKVQAVSVATNHLEKRLDAAEAVHLLSRTGIGSSPQDVLRYTGLKRAAAIDSLLAEINTTPFLPVPAWVNEASPHYSFRGSMPINQQRAFDRQRDAELAQMRQWWISEMLQTPSPQTERLVLFWHNHFVSAYSAIGRQSTSMARQNQLFRRYAKGNFRDFVKAVLRDPAMLDYLDNRSNRKKSPNENFGRELLELFTLGEGNYSEADVKNAARALTGFTVAGRHDMRFQFAANHHDFGEKTLFGKSGRFGADQLVDLIMEQPAVAVFLTRKFWQEYVNSTTINEAAVETIAANFRRSDYSLEVLLRSLLKHEEFWAPHNRQAVIKSPVDLVLGLFRTRGMGREHAPKAVTALAQQGQNLFEPPNVAGWSGGESWITPNRLLSRMTWLQQISGDLVEPVATPLDVEKAGTDHDGMKSESAAMLAPTGNSMTMQSAATDNEMNPVGSSNEMMSGSTMLAEKVYENGVTVARSANAKSSKTRIVAKLASDDFRGTPEVNIHLLSQGEVVWKSAVVQLKPGRDTLRHGVSTGYSDFLFRKYNFSAEDLATAQLASGKNKQPGLPDYDEVRLHFSNDLSDGDGDRNLYVEWVSINGDVLHASAGRQQSQCIPANPFNAGHLYCMGYLSMQSGHDALDPTNQHSVDYHPFNSNGLRAAQVFLDRAHPLNGGKPKNPSVAFTLANVVFGDRQWKNLQVQLVKLQDGGYQMVLGRYDCWPDCLQQWPACSNRSKPDPYYRAIRIRLEAGALDPDVKGQGGGCRISDLHSNDAQLVIALWGALADMAGAVKDDRKLTRGNFLARFNRWLKPIDKVDALAPASMTAGEASTPHLTELLPVKPATINASMESMSDSSIVPVSHSADTAQQAVWLESVETLLKQNHLAGSLHTLFAPIDRQSEVADDADSLQSHSRHSRLSQLISSPAFQLK